MDPKLQVIADNIQKATGLSGTEKELILQSIKDADKAQSLSKFKLERLEHDKHTLSVKLEESIEDLQKKSAAIEQQNRELEIESSLERVRSVAMGMKKPEDMLDVCKTIAAQLETLKVQEIRNVQTAIFVEAKSMYFNYEFYSKHNKTLITEVDYADHPVSQNFAEQMLRGANQVWMYAFKDQEVKDWLNYQKNTNVFIDTYLENARTLDYYWYSLGPVAIGMSAYVPLREEEIELFKRFRNVFELAYRRYLDIQKAEAQAREASIEAALEKVRSKANAMHRSENLLEVIKEVHAQLRHIEFRFDSADFLTDYTDKGYNIWLATADPSIPSPIFVPYFDHRIFHLLNEEVKQGHDFFTFRLTKDEKNEYFRHVFATSLAQYEQEESRKFVLSAEGMATSCVVLKNIILSITNFASIPYTEEENNIIKRFAYVFEQSYVRFLDLKKAEAQAREAQIQLALERVRARTMAMHNSNEFGEVAALLFEQVKQLGIETYASGFNIWDKEHKNLISWMSNPTGSINPPFEMPIHTYDQHERIYQSWKNHESFIEDDITGAALERHYKFLRSFPLLDEAFSRSEKAGIESPARQVHNNAHFSNGYLLFITGEPRAEAQEIFIRFAKVFEQTYTRFLDLQKAEEQSRESQIELGLERVRARAMAMQRSDELKELVATVSEELAKLDFALDRSIISIIDLQTLGQTWWMSHPESPTPVGLFMKYHEHKPYLDLLQAWRERQLKFQYILEGELKKGWDSFLFVETELSQLPGIVKDSMRSKEKVYLSASFNNFGCLCVATLEPLSEQQFDILLRFAKVFDNTYTRFNDLKQAEAQARESQIQLALERVRARTMAMQRSEELSEAVYVLFQQFKELGENPDQATIGVVNEEERVIEYWVTMYGKQIDRVFKFSIDEPHVTNKIYEAWKKGDRSLVIDLSGKELYEFTTYRESMGGAKHNPEEKRRVINVAFFSKGLLNVQSNQTRSYESIRLLERFAAVFDQTYTRFIDLQRAETQARESQIQLALERVRARTMAMQKSDELTNVAELLFKQVNELGVRAWTTGFNVWSEDNTFYTDYVTDPQGGFMPPYTVEVNKMPVLVKVSDAKKRGDDFLVNYEEGETLAETYRQLTRSGERQYKSILESGFEFPAHQYEHFVFGATVSLMFITYDPVPEAHEIFKRFGKVFEQTYTRFLDLQKAESQAREAQIEAALEKVRSRSLAMHKSGELQEVVHTVFERLRELNVQVYTAIIIIFEEGSKDIVWWMQNKINQQYSRILIKYSGIPYLEDLFDAKEKGKELFSKCYIGEEKRKLYDYLFHHTDLKSVPEEQKKFLLENEFAAISIAFAKNTAIHLTSYSERSFSEEDREILKRFAKVFDQAYTRFLDLQKAEAQAKEAQIEAALERVRSKAMAMHKADDLNPAVAIVFEELDKLNLGMLRCGIGIIDKQKRTVAVWTTSVSDERNTVQASGTMPVSGTVQVSGAEPMDIHPLLQGAFDAWARRKDFSYTLRGEDLFQYYSAVGETNIRLPQSQTETTTQYYHMAAFDLGALFAFRETEFSDEGKVVMKRFANVFNLTYKRFLDLQKAEAQAREAQIQLALERVRARTMAMQHSNEHTDAAMVMFKQLEELGVNAFACGFVILDKNETEGEFWMSSEGVFQPPHYIPHMEEPSIRNMYMHWKSGEESYAEDVGGVALKLHYKYLVSLPKSGSNFQGLLDAGITFPKWQRMYAAYFAHGYLLIITKEQYKEEEIFIRFAKVFEQTYTRFLDLQRAEAQAREGQIQLALERVRARTMAMQKSEELREVVAVIYEQLQQLGFVQEGSCNINIMDGSTGNVDWWMTGFGNQKYPHRYHVEYINHPMHTTQLALWKSGKKYTTIEVAGESKKEFDRLMFSQADFEKMSVETKTMIASLDRVIFSMAFMKYGALSWAANPITDEQADILQRFARVFEQTYTRFLDLQKAEAQAREAQIETALEKVRSRTLAMQKSDELAETATVVFRQLILLGIEPNRLFITIIKDENGESEFWVTDEDGSKVSTAYTANLNDNPSFKKMYDGWKQERKSMMIDMQGRELDDFFTHLSSLRVPFKREPSQKKRLEYIAYFAKGFIGMASPEEQPLESMQLLERFAAVFNLTFTRFNDLKIAEAHALKAEQDLIEIKAARKHAEDSLVELQAAQRQLVQSEKMASLGELTAGIAHEIQNPLNFVNNFSDVSNELLAEMKTELEKGNTKDAASIVDDVRQNLEKILYHGKRADAIVKGMLQHSRTSGGQKELTDINALADEYLRLAYHGLRAKDKFFNAKFITEFDDGVGKISIIPQEIGRVILNLINNAFYTVSEKQKRLNGSFEPTVSVSTKKVDDKLLITIADNGNGIPQKNLDKIFQPFFTTKPTGQGTGLGLSLSYDIVKAHGGEITVNTKEGQGSRFVIQLPLNYSPLEDRG